MFTVQLYCVNSAVNLSFVLGDDDDDDDDDGPNIIPVLYGICRYIIIRNLIVLLCFTCDKNKVVTYKSKQPTPFLPYL